MEDKIRNKKDLLESLFRKELLDKGSIGYKRESEERLNTSLSDDFTISVGEGEEILNRPSGRVERTDYIPNRHY